MSKNTVVIISCILSAIAVCCSWTSILKQSVGWYLATVLVGLTSLGFSMFALLAF